MPVFSRPLNRRWLCQLLLLILLFALVVGGVWWYFELRIKAFDINSSGNKIGPYN